MGDFLLWFYFLDFLFLFMGLRTGFLEKLLWFAFWYFYLWKFCYFTDLIVKFVFWIFNARNFELIFRNFRLFRFPRDPKPRFRIIFKRLLQIRLTNLNRFIIIQRIHYYLTIDNYSISWAGIFKHSRYIVWTKTIIFHDGGRWTGEILTIFKDLLNDFILIFAN